MNRENQNGLTVGDVVVSCAGRDRGIAFVVVWQDGKMLSLCDGKVHKAGKVKKKKIKHVQKTDRHILLPSAYDDNRDGTFDAEIRKALRCIEE